MKVKTYIIFMPRIQRLFLYEKFYKLYFGVYYTERGKRRICERRRNFNRNFDDKFLLRSWERFTSMSLDQMCNFIFFTKVSTWVPPTIHLRAVKFYEPTWCIRFTWCLNLVTQQICGRAHVSAFIRFWLPPDNWLKNARFYVDSCIYMTIAVCVNIS